MQTLLADLNSITNDSHFIWFQEDKYALESQLLLATAQPLCLNPSPMVSIVRNRALRQKNFMNDRGLKRFCIRYSEAYRLKAQRWSQYALPYPFQILKFKNKAPKEGGVGDEKKKVEAFFNSFLSTSRNYSLDRRYQQELNERSNSFQVILVYLINKNKFIFK